MIEIQWTCGSIDEARRVGRELVKDRLVACVNIIPWVESIYLWDGKMETEQETKVLFKTVLSNFDAVRAYIEQHARYEVPEITYREVDGSNETYLEWLNSQVLLK